MPYFMGDDLGVYKWINGEKKNYICIVDYVIAKDEAQFNDYVAKRLLSLKNDTDVSKEIYTLGIAQ